MKTLCSILFSAVILWPILVNSIIILDFKIDQAKIVAEQCVQRNASENNCKGSCALGEKLSSVSAGGEHEKQPVLFNSDLSYFLWASALELDENESRNCFVIFYSSTQPEGVNLPSWKPPRLV